MPRKRKSDNPKGLPKVKKVLDERSQPSEMEEDRELPKNYRSAASNQVNAEIELQEGQIANDTSRPGEDSAAAANASDQERSEPVAGPSRAPTSAYMGETGKPVVSKLRDGAAIREAWYMSRDLPMSSAKDRSVRNRISAERLLEQAQKQKRELDEYIRKRSEQLKITRESGILLAALNLGREQADPGPEFPEPPQPPQPHPEGHQAELPATLEEEQEEIRVDDPAPTEAPPPTYEEATSGQGDQVVPIVEVNPQVNNEPQGEDNDLQQAAGDAASLPPPTPAPRPGRVPQPASSWPRLLPPGAAGAASQAPRMTAPNQPGLAANQGLPEARPPIETAGPVRVPLRSYFPEPGLERPRAHEVAHLRRWLGENREYGAPERQDYDNYVSQVRARSLTILHMTRMCNLVRSARRTLGRLADGYVNQEHLSLRPFAPGSYAMSMNGVIVVMDDRSLDFEFLIEGEHCQEQHNCWQTGCWRPEARRAAERLRGLEPASQLAPSIGDVVGSVVTCRRMHGFP